jgi:hypothetical protein
MRGASPLSDDDKSGPDNINVPMFECGDFRGHGIINISKAENNEGIHRTTRTLKNIILIYSWIQLDLTSSPLLIYVDLNFSLDMFKR